VKIAVLTANVPLYLPAFFDRFLERRARDVVGVFICRPVYKGQTAWTMLRRYSRTFGLWNAFRLTRRVASAKAKDILRIGRRKRRFHSVASAVRYHGVPVFFPRDVNAPEFLDQLRRLGADLVLSVSCPQIFGQELIALPTKGCLNIHGADLPRYRGIMPSFWMLANQEKQAAVTIFFVNTGIDTGDVVGRKVVPILPQDTLHSFVLRSKQIACDLALEVLDQIETGRVQRTPLVGKGSYYGWPTHEAYRKFRSAGRRLW